MDDANDPGVTVSVDLLRRRLLQAGFSGTALSMLPFKVAYAASTGGSFQPIAASTEDLLRIPEGYVAEVLFAWGDPVSDGPAFRSDAGNSAADQAQQAGMHHDGMHFFPFMEDGKPSSVHGLLCINHEYTDEGLLHRGGPADWNHEKTVKSQNAHGVSIIEVRRDGNAPWQVVRPSNYARRITARSPMRISGPAASSPALRTSGDRRGDVVFGTLANCAMGFTPWGTYLSCEENFHGYFNGIATPTAAQQRYGIRAGGAGLRWHQHDARFDVATEPNEPNRFGWVVEIDPWNPGRPPIKRTALGRFKHESATVTLAADRRVVVYMGDDEAFEYIYKFVSQDRFDEKNPAANVHLLDRGTLYVARFGEGGQGQWLALQHGSKGLDAAGGFAEQADVLINARAAADVLGATKMDRPEWIAVHPHSGEVYCALSNNRQRGAEGKAPVDGANPRADNRFGHILCWREAGGDAAAKEFTWVPFALAGDPGSDDPAKRGTVRGDAFANPDGLRFDAQGRLWIQTDISARSLGEGDFAAMGNNQVLVADLASGQTRRFLTGPRGCEITGLTGTPDGRCIFLNVQHPGETPGGVSDPAQPTAISGWPANQFPRVTGGRPRSATVVITRFDSGVIGE